MDDTIFDYEKSICSMLIKYIDKLDFLNNDDKAMSLKLGLLYKNQINRLYRIYDFLNSEEKEFIDNNIKFEKQDSNLCLNIKGKTMIISIKNFKNLLEGSIDILEDILPIGTIIELKNKFIKSLYKDTKFKENPKFIIIRRFLSKEGSLAYFPYAAVPYPTGELNDRNNIYLTSQAIEKVVYKGFSDEKDLAFICVMKSEMIFRKNMKSISFSSEEERLVYINQ